MSLNERANRVSLNDMTEENKAERSAFEQADEADPPASVSQNQDSNTMGQQNLQDQ